jgi:RNA polymerase sigma-70 factor (ECF subfamily)
MQPDLDLVDRLKLGDEAAFTVIYASHRDRVYRFALLFCGSVAAAADVTQDTFEHLIRKPEQFDAARGTLAAWLCGVARNLARREAGVLHRCEPTDDAVHEALIDRATPLDRVLREETAEAVRAALLEVAPPYRDVLVLCTFSDASYAEAAQACGIDIGTVRSRLHRGRAQLALALARAGFGPAAAVTQEVSA